MKYVICPPIDPSYINKVYSIEINGELYCKVVGVKQATRKTKWLKYNNLSNSITLKNITNNIIVKIF